MANGMTRTVSESESQLTGEVVSKLKLYESDHALAVKLQEQVQPLFRQITIQEILRDAIHAGLPVVSKRYKAAVEAAKKADKE